MTYSLREGVSLAESERGAVLLDEHSGKYWQLNGSGHVVLRGLLDGQEPAQVASGLAARYAVGADRTARDVDALVEALCRAKLVSA
jgi:hypothetical protein